MISAARLTLACSILWLCACEENQSIVAGDPKPDRRAAYECNSIEALLDLPDDEIDLATAALLLCREIDPSVDVATMRAQIDVLARKVEERLTPGDRPVSKAGCLVSVINFDAGFESSNRMEECFRLSEVIRNGGGNCLGMTMLYLCVAERARIPLYGVEIPYHIFLRYDDGTDELDLEPTAFLTRYPNGYPSPFFFSERDRDQSDKLKTLDTKQVLAAYIATVAAVEAKQRGKRASQLAKLAVRLYPERSESHMALGWTYWTREEFDEAEAAYKHAIRKRPDNVDAWTALGRLRHSQGKHNAALALYERATEVEPNYPVHWFYMGLAHQDAKRFHSAIEALDRALKVNWTQLHPNRRYALEQNFRTRREFAAQVYDALKDCWWELAERLDAKDEDALHVHENAMVTQAIDVLLSDGNLSDDLVGHVEKIGKKAAERKDKRLQLYMADWHRDREQSEQAKKEGR